MEKRSIVLLSVFIVMFCGTQVSLDYFLPQARTDFEVWLHYFIIKDALYDTMLFFLSIITFIHVKNVLKALTCFCVIVTGGSFIDKVIFNINQYLFSDIILIIAAVSLSLYLYLTKWKT